MKTTKTFGMKGNEGPHHIYWSKLAHTGGCASLEGVDVVMWAG